MQGMAGRELPTPPTNVEAADILEELGHSELDQRVHAREVGILDGSLLAANGTLIVLLLSWHFNS